ncbi:uncharacterized protein V2V93DRAFT_363620 [Kockiozyma suomiensis]|uniref:uncharacterized protein n=1 Tax=Kockiozyma suomiensis TaxID=1337062 RepID=UPI003343EF22
MPTRAQREDTFMEFSNIDRLSPNSNGASLPESQLEPWPNPLTQVFNDWCRTGTSTISQDLDIFIQHIKKLVLPFAVVVEPDAALVRLILQWLPEYVRECGALWERDSVRRARRTLHGGDEKSDEYLKYCESAREKVAEVRQGRRIKATGAEKSVDYDVQDELMLDPKTGLSNVLSRSELDEDSTKFVEMLEKVFTYSHCAKVPVSTLGVAQRKNETVQEYRLRRDRREQNYLLNEGVDPMKDFLNGLLPDIRQSVEETATRKGNVSSTTTVSPELAAVASMSLDDAYKAASQYEWHAKMMQGFLEGRDVGDEDESWDDSFR